MLDVRKPLGLLFMIIGELLFVYGLVFSEAVEFYTPHTHFSLKLNQPVGVFMFAFGLIMWQLARFVEINTMDREMRNRRQELGMADDDDTEGGGKDIEEEDDDVEEEDDEDVEEADDAEEEDEDVEEADDDVEESDDAVEEADDVQEAVKEKSDSEDDDSSDKGATAPTGPKKRGRPRKNPEAPEASSTKTKEAGPSKTKEAGSSKTKDTSSAKSKETKSKETGSSKKKSDSTKPPDKNKKKGK